MNMFSGETETGKRGLTGSGWVVALCCLSIPALADSAGGHGGGHGGHSGSGHQSGVAGHGAGESVSHASAHSVGDHHSSDHAFSGSISSRHHDLHHHSTLDYGGHHDIGHHGVYSHGHIFFGFGYRGIYPSYYQRDYCSPYSLYYDPAFCRYRYPYYLPTTVAPSPATARNTLTRDAEIPDGVAAHVPLLSNPDAPEVLP